MKRFEIDAFISHPTSEMAKAIPTMQENESGRFVRYADVEALIKKAEYWEEEFRQECRRVRDLCEMRDKARAALTRIQEDIL